MAALPYSAAVMMLLAYVANASETYTNPIVREPNIDLGDPGALYVDGAYYLATSSGDNADAFPIHRSADLVTWTQVGHVFPQWAGRKNPAWAQADFWAPDLQRVNGSFACYFSARHGTGIAGRLSLGVAFSDNVTGPYTDALGHPLWEDTSNPQGTIDVHFHQTSGGDKFLLWKANQHPVWTSAHIMMQQLGGDGASLTGSAWSLMSADQAWEEWGCVEAPWLLERNGTFYLFYSASMVNFDTYAIGVSRSQDVRGPYEKRDLPILHQCGYDPPTASASAPVAATSGTGICPGHCSVLPVHGQSDRYVMFYHGRTQQATNRTLNMDELRWNSSDGWPYLTGACPSSVPQPVP